MPQRNCTRPSSVAATNLPLGPFGTYAAGMEECGSCGANILFGGQEAGGNRYCSRSCLERARAALLAGEVDPAEVQREMANISLGACPECGDRTAPVGVWVAHRVYGLAIVTRWTSKPQISCASCGRKALVAGILFSLVFGWWGLPWGLLITPLQITRNVLGLTPWADPNNPQSPLLYAMAARRLADSKLARGAVPAAFAQFPRSVPSTPLIRFVNRSARGVGRFVRRAWNSVARR